MSDSPVVDKIREQSGWYSRKARCNQMIFLSMKTLQLVMAAAIPVLALVSKSERAQWATAILGAMVGVVEGLLQLGQYQQKWLLFRTTREALRREEFLHLAKAGPYAAAADADREYAVRADVILSGESTKWLQMEQQVDTKHAAA